MICSDKTGTLTQNKMSVNQFWNTNIVNFLLIFMLRNLLIKKKRLNQIYMKNSICQKLCQKDFKKFLFNL